MPLSSKPAPTLTVTATPTAGTERTTPSASTERLVTMAVTLAGAPKNGGSGELTALTEVPL